MKTKTKRMMTKQKKAQGLVPRLRFPEFREAGDWTSKKLMEVSEINPSSSALPECFNYIDLESVQGGRLLNVRRINRENAPSRAQRLLSPGDILFQTVRPYQQDNYLFKSSDEQYVASTGYAQLRSLQDIGFLYHYIHTEPFAASAIDHCTGSNYPAITSSALAQLTVNVPSTVEEQQKIADCLTSLDDLITAHTEQLEALKERKKGLLQNLFPREGERVPRLRFPEFRDAGEWEIKEFGDLFKVGNGRDYRHLGPGDIPVFGSGGYMGSVDDYIYYGESVCIGRKGTIDNPIFLTGKFWTVDTLFYTHTFSGCIPRFIYLLFQRINWLIHNEAGGVPSLTKTNIVRMKACIPDLAEQQKITDFLSSLDDKIDQLSHTLEGLKIHKKALMQQLFPSV